MRNTFYHGDCKFVMEHDIVPESVDLIYLDPPFFTGQIQRGTAKWHPEAMEISFDDSRRFWGNTEKVRVMRSKAPEWLIHIATKRPDFASYLFYMMERLNLCKKVLKSTGSIYLHCDWRASHYLKMVMDEVFGVENFRDDIAWCYTGPSNTKRWFPRKHDNLLFYVKNEQEGQFFSDTVRVSYKEDSFTMGGSGSLTAKNREGNYRTGMEEQLAKGKIIEDYWTDIPSLSVSTERIGYPTQKPTKLLERIILASSNEGDTVLDPFCGCGTTIIAAQLLKRTWVGIDINRTAYDATTGREIQLPLGMNDSLATAHFVCRDLEAVKNLPHDEFEFWVNEYYGAIRPSPDAGVDGITKDGMPIQTKAWGSSKVNDSLVRQFKGDAENHPSVSQPVKRAILVSQSGFEDSARSTAYTIQSRFGIEIELKTPEDLLETKEQ